MIRTMQHNSHLRANRARHVRQVAAFALLAACSFVFARGPRLHAQAAPASAAPRAELTVERIYSQPSLSGRTLRDTVWSPDGKWLTYLSDEDPAGAAAGDAAASPGPQIWAVDSSTGAHRVLIDAEHLRNILLPAASRGQQTGLGRLTPARYAWAPDSRAILFISAKELFWYDLTTKASKQLVKVRTKSGRNTSGDNKASGIDDVKISPDGRNVSFVRDHDLWVVNVAGGEERQLTRGGNEAVRNAELDWVYPEELDLSTASWWSPDSSQIAFLQLDESAVEKYPLTDYLGGLTEERYPVAGSANPVARVGVVPVTGGAVRWMDTGADKTALLARVDWLRDSKQVSIIRLNRIQNHLDLIFADPVTGKAHVALSEQDKYWINLTDHLHFMRDGQHFLWSSERSGFRHLYIYDLAGKQPVQLTRGDWEVEDVAGVDENKGFVYFTATMESSIERHLYRVPLAGGAPVKLTAARGNHEINAAPDCAYFLDTFSTAVQPPRQVLYKMDGNAVATLAENKVQELATYRLQPVEFFTVPGADGTPLNAAMIKPENFDPSRKYPVIVHLYGGPHVQEVRDEWQGTNFLWHQLMAEKGFIIFVLDNRGMAGRGHNFETPIYRQFGRVELADQLAGAAWLKSQPFVDSNRIGIWGWSFGGYMSCLAMLRGGDVFKAGFAGAPVTDWRLYDTIYTERYMGTPQDNPQGYRDASPVTFAAGLTGKLLIVHATGDDNVHFANTVELAERFVQAQKYAEYEIYAGRGHGISDAPGRIHVFNRVTQFFIENLRN